MTCDHLDKQTSLFFYFGKTWSDISCKQRSWIVKHIHRYDDVLILDCYYLYHLPTQLFSKQLDLTRNCLYFYHLYSSFFKNLQDTMTFKKYFVLFIYVILSDAWIRITLRWYKTIKNQVEWTCKMKIKRNIFWQSHTIAHLNEFRQVNNPKPETVNICSGHEIHHTPLLFILQSLLNRCRLFLIWWKK